MLVAHCFAGSCMLSGLSVVIKLMLGASLVYCWEIFYLVAACPPMQQPASSAADKTKDTGVAMLLRSMGWMQPICPLASKVNRAHLDLIPHEIHGSGVMGLGIC